MKNKTPLIIIIVVLVVLAGAWFFFMRGGATNPLTPQTPQEQVENAFMGSGSVKCEYTTDTGEVVTAYVKDGKMRTDMTGGAEGTMSFMMVDKTSYSWNQDTREGMKYVIPDVTPVAEVEVETVESGQADPRAMQEQIEQYKESCSNQAVDDSLFVVPTDVNFVDYSTMMQDTMQQVPQEYQQYMPQQ